MGYLGNNLQAAYSSYLLIDSISSSFNGTTTSFPLRVNGITPVPFPLNEQNVLISVGGVPQKPDASGAEGFKFSGSNIVFSSAPKTGEAFWGVVLAGADYVSAGAVYPDGTAANPGMVFTSDKTTGFYRFGSGQVGLGVNGATPLVFGTSGIQFNGATSGYTLLSAPSAGGNNTLTLPASNGAANQLLKNSSTAGQLTYSQATEDSSGNFAFNSGYGSVAPVYGCRAWVNFNGGGTIGTNQTIRASGNVASVYKNGTGDYTITFTTPMPDANYSATVSYNYYSSASWIGVMYINSMGTSSIRFSSKDSSGAAPTVDPSFVCVAIFR